MAYAFCCTELHRTYACCCADHNVCLLCMDRALCILILGHCCVHPFVRIVISFCVASPCCMQCSIDKSSCDCQCCVHQGMRDKYALTWWLQRDQPLQPSEDKYCRDCQCCPHQASAPIVLAPFCMPAQEEHTFSTEEFKENVCQFCLRVKVATRHWKVSMNKSPHKPDLILHSNAETIRRALQGTCDCRMWPWKKIQQRFDHHNTWTLQHVRFDGTGSIWPACMKTLPPHLACWFKHEMQRLALTGEGIGLITWDLPNHFRFTQTLALPYKEPDHIHAANLCDFKTSAHNFTMSAFTSLIYHSSN